MSEIKCPWCAGKMIKVPGGWCCENGSRHWLDVTLGGHIAGLQQRIAELEAEQIDEAIEAEEVREVCDCDQLDDDCTYVSAIKPHLIALAEAVKKEAGQIVLENCPDNQEGTPCSHCLGVASKINSIDPAQIGAESEEQK